MCLRVVCVMLVAASGTFLPAGLLPRAAASCGDWLAPADHMTTEPMITAAEDLSSDVASERAVDESTPQPQSKLRHRDPAPCDEMHCGKLPMDATLPLSHNVPPRRSDVAVVSCALGDVSTSAVEYLSPGGLVSALKGFPLRIDHPPRV